MHFQKCVGLSMGTELNTTQIALLEAIKAALFGTNPNYPADTNWIEVIKEAKAQTVLGIISFVIPVKDVSVEMGKATYMRLLYEQDKLIKLLDANDISCVIIKGFAAAQYYPKPHLRAMGDVDFLVPKDKFLYVSRLLEVNRYTYHHGKTEVGIILKDVRHIEYTKNGIDFELHQFFSSPGFDMDDILEQAINNREYHDLDGYRIPMLPEIENGLVLLGHINHHLKNNNLGLRQIIDWEMYVYQVMNRDLWNRSFVPVLRKIGLDKLAINVTAMCIKYFGLPNSIGLSEQSEEERNSLLEILFENGNFGRKANESIALSNNRKTMETIYNIKHNGFFKYFHSVGVNMWSPCKRFPILKSFAWVYGLFRTLYKGITANIKIGAFKEQAQKSRERHNVYRKIGVKTDNNRQFRQ